MLRIRHTIASQKKEDFGVPAFKQQDFYRLYKGLYVLGSKHFPLDKINFSKFSLGSKDNSFLEVV